MHTKYMLHLDTLKLLPILSLDIMSLVISLINGLLQVYL